jgi:soluble lytic murein transglycosylase-like protein
VAEALLHAAEKHGVDPALVVALSWQESRFRVDAAGVNTNKTTDRGLMQLNSATFSHLDEDDFFNPVLNADLGVSYLKRTLELSGNVVAALAMYNAGPGRVGSTGAPKSTLDYISKIMTHKAALVKEYQDRYGSNGILMSREIRPLKNPDLL